MECSSFDTFSSTPLTIKESLEKSLSQEQKTNRESQNTLKHSNSPNLYKFTGNDTSFASKFSGVPSPDITKSKESHDTEKLGTRNDKLTLGSLRERFAKKSSARFGSSSDISKDHKKSSSSSWISLDAALDKHKKKTRSFRIEEFEEEKVINGIPKSSENDINSLKLEEDQNTQEHEIRIIYDDELSDDESIYGDRQFTNITVNWDEIKMRVLAKSTTKSNKSLETKSYAQKFRAKLLPGESEVAEQELKKQLSKDMFKNV